MLEVVISSTKRCFCSVRVPLRTHPIQPLRFRILGQQQQIRLPERITVGDLVGGALGYGERPGSDEVLDSLHGTDVGEDAQCHDGHDAEDGEQHNQFGAQ